MKRPKLEDPNQNGLFVVDDPDEDVRAVAHERSHAVYRVRAHPFDRLKAWDFTVQSESAAQERVKYLQKNLRQAGVTIVLEVDSVVQSLWVKDSGQWLEEKQS